MAIRVKHNVLTQISLDTLATEKTYYPTTKEVVSDGFDGQMSSNISVAIAGSLSLTFGDVAAVKGLNLEVSADCVIRLNGSSDDIQLRRKPDAITGDMATFFIEGDISALIVDNSAGSAILTGFYVVWGDPTP